MSNRIERTNSACVYEPLVCKFDPDNPQSFLATVERFAETAFNYPIQIESNTKDDIQAAGEVVVTEFLKQESEGYFSCNCAHCHRYRRD